jgi:hypothetical protein
VEEDKIIGIANSQELTIAKNDIRVIKKIIRAGQQLL